MRLSRALLAASIWWSAQALPGTARADNAMGYRLITQDEAAGLQRHGGTLGLELQHTKMIDEPGMTFELMRVTRVHDHSPGARAGLRQGDELISVNGRVFPSLAVFAAYVGSLAPGQPATIDYIPSGGGPAQAQRIKILPGAAEAEHHGLTTRDKVAIGVGAAALFGCYEMGCFDHRRTSITPPPQPLTQPPPLQSPPIH